MTVIEGPAELSIRVRWLSYTKSIVLLGVLVPFFAVMISMQQHKTPFIVLTVVLSYPALLLAFNAYRLKAVDGRVSVSFGPVPISRSRSLAASDIRDVFCTRTSTRTGRGTIERYSLRVRTRNGPVTLLDTERKSDAEAAVGALTRWLSAHPSVRG